MNDADEPDLSGIALAQGDIAVNLFVILLVVLSVLSVAQVSSSADGYLTPYSRGIPDVTAGPPVLGWQPVLPLYPKLVLRKGIVHLVYLVPLGDAFGSGRPLVLGPDVVDNSRTLPDDLDPAAYQVFLRFYGSADFPEALSGISAPLSALGETEGQGLLDAVSGKGKIDLFVSPGEVGQLAPLVDALHKRRIAVRIAVLPRDDLFGFAQSGRDFGLERAFK